ncbi:hypothetical protein ACFWNR_39145 [Streptomyces virginiae]
MTPAETLAAEGRKGRIEEFRDEGPHAVHRMRNEETDEIQVITQGQIL